MDLLAGENGQVRGERAVHRTMVPLSMKTAREEVLLALSSPNRRSANLHRRRAVNLLKDAVTSIQADPTADYNWSLLRSDTPSQ